MNIREKSETRELTEDELNHVSGGIWWAVAVGVFVVSAGLVGIGLADATGAVDSLVKPIQWPR